MKKIFIVFACLVFGGCASSSNLVTLSPGGKYVVEGFSSIKEDSIYDAKKQANDFCKKEKKMVMINNEETIYQGILPDKVASKITGLSATDFKTTLEFECR